MGLTKDVRQAVEFVKWIQRGFSSPAPNSVKRRTLLRHCLPNADFIETGTYLGDTAQFLRNHGYSVTTIEVEKNLFKRASERFAKDAKVVVLNGDSGELIQSVVEAQPKDLNFWLDGHYSGGFTGKGLSDTPIKKELEVIASHFSKNPQLNLFVAVDDVRCFNPDHPDFKDYPPLSYLVEWAEGLNGTWSIEHDIFLFSRKAIRKLH